MTRVELDPSLKQAIASGTPVEVIDSSTSERFYLLTAEQFRLLAGTLSDDYDPREAYPVIDQIMAPDDANDPLLDSYQ
jgi:hypothetical protein